MPRFVTGLLVLIPGLLASSQSGRAAEPVPDAVVVVHLDRPLGFTAAAGAARGPLVDKVNAAIKANGKEPPRVHQLFGIACKAPEVGLCVTVYKDPGDKQQVSDWSNANDSFKRGVVARGVLLCLPVPKGAKVAANAGILGPVHLVANIHDVRAPEEKEVDRVPAKGKAFVEGEVVAGKFAWGKEEAELAIRNGDSPIVLAGKAAADARGLKGPVRVMGELQFDGQARPRIVVEKVEGLKR